MAKRAKTSSFQAKKLKACQQRKVLEDQISNLPDVIIVYILSLLTMKEAGQTCVLSKRWRYSWAYIPTLNFDGSNTVDDIMLGKKVFHVEKPRYLHWVKEVVGSYRGPTIDEFRVRFDLSVTSRYSIDNWVKFAMEKRVKRFELDLFPDERSLISRSYTFRDSLISNLLTSLKLVSVNVTGNVLQNFLIHCPNLECLLVRDSISLVNLEATGDALNLRYLVIRACDNIQHLTVSAPNLASFNFEGPKICMPLKIAPKLSKLSVGGAFGKFFIINALEFSSYLFQLEALRLELSYDIENVMTPADQFPVCTRLKRLELIVNPLTYIGLLRFANILTACPVLHEFVLTLYWFSNNTKNEWFEVEACQFYNLNLWEVETRPHYHVNDHVGELVFELCPYEKVNKKFEGKVCRHDHLKTVKIVGFVGNPIELEFIIYLMERCIALEKLVIDPRDPLLSGFPPESQLTLKEAERETTARKKAELLRAIFTRPDVDLIIL